MALTDKQQRFCEEYLIDLNATQAAIRAGYSEKTANEQGAQNLVKLSSYISELKAEKSKELNITFEDVAKGVYDIFQSGDRNADRLKAADQLSKMLGFYEKDNTQKQPINNINLKDLVRFK